MSSDKDLDLTIRTNRPDGASLPGGATNGSLANPDAPVPFVFGKRIAQGGMGAILEAQDCKIGRTIAVKLMLSELNVDEGQKQRFINEAAVLGKLAHPNIVPVYDLGRTSGGELYYTMKLVKGRTLKDILYAIRDGDAETTKQYTLDRLLTIFRKVCDAMAFAHSHHIIHRDLKPDNIMVGEFGEVLVMDWGLAKFLQGTTPQTPLSMRMTPEQQAAFEASGTNFGMTMEGDVMGTPQYMSPEQANGSIAEMDARSDIFSLGGILYTILTLRPPVVGRGFNEILRNVATGNITSPTVFGTSAGKNMPKPKGSRPQDPDPSTPLPHMSGGRVPAALAAVVMKALTVEREKRYQNVAALSADIEAYQGGFATSAENAGTWKQFTLLVKRNKAASLGLAAVLVIGGTLGTKALIEGRRAARALAELKENAPAMLALAESEAATQHFKSALEKTDAALRLDSGLLPAYWRRAWGLVALGRFSDAATALRTASERDPAHARQFGVILPQIEKIAAVPGEAERYTPDLLTPVFEFLNTHDALGEAGALIQHLRLTNDQRFAIARERLKALGGSTSGLNQLPTGLIELTPGVAGLKSLEQVRGIPCDILYVRNANIESLEPLRGLHLSKLDLDTNRISDLAPLRGMALVELNLGYCGSAFSDLSPLAGMPLRILRLMGCSGVVDLSPLHGLPLEDLSLDGTPVSDLGPLAGMPLCRLNAGAGRDLRPLAGMPLEYLSLPDISALNDLSPLASLPLKELFTRSAKLKDLTPLLRVPTLERLTTVVSPDVLAPLRQHPRLAFINYQNKGYRPVAEVWAELDAQAGKK